LSPIVLIYCHSSGAADFVAFVACGMPIKRLSFTEFRFAGNPDLGICGVSETANWTRAANRRESADPSASCAAMVSFFFCLSENPQNKPPSRSSARWKVKNLFCPTDRRTFDLWPRE
jgi:hypothetical protein